MPDPLLDNTKALEEMVAALRQQTPVGGTPYSNAMQRSLDILTQRMDKLAELYRMGVTPGSIGAQAARASVVEQQNYAAQRYASLTMPEQRAFMPQMQVLQKGQVEKEEIERRKQLNMELLRSQHALTSFISAASQGSAGGMIGAGAGFIGGKAGLVLGATAIIAEAIQKMEQRYRAESRQGGAELMPALEQTRQQSAELARMRLAANTGETVRMREEARMEQLRAQARTLPGWGRFDDPADPLNRFLHLGGALPVSQAGRAIAARGVAETAAAGQGPQRMEAAGLRVWADYFARRLREAGREPQEFKEDVFMPNRARFTAGEEYYQSLGNAALEASGQQASNEVIRLQMEANGLLAQINNRLDRANPPIFGP